MEFQPDEEDFNPLGTSIWPTAHAPNVRSLKFVKFADVKLPSGSRYLVKGILPTTGLVVLWGAPKCGKSFFAFDLTVHVAAGWEYRGRKVKQRSVVYFALEGQEGFAARIDAFRKANLVEDDLPFFLSADRIVLPQDGEAIVGSIRRQFPDVSPGVVVLDTLNRSIAGSENDPKDMGAYVRAADAIREAFECAVIVIHHCGVEGMRPRGHTSLTGAADAQLAVKRDKDGNIVTTVEFMKDGPEGDQIVSRLKLVSLGVDEDGDEMTSCVIEPVLLAEDGPQVSKQTARALQILRDCLASQGELPLSVENVPIGTRTISKNQWRDACYEKMFVKHATQTAKQKAFVRAVDALIDKKIISKQGDVVWVN